MVTFTDAKKRKIPLTLIVGEKDLVNNTGSLNIHNAESENNKNIKELVNIINREVTEPKFDF